MLPLKRIYIESHHITTDSKSSSDFRMDLPINITLPPNSAFCITAITIPVSWYTVETKINHTIYFTINGPA